MSRHQRSGRSERDRLGREQFAKAVAARLFDGGAVATFVAAAVDALGSATIISVAAGARASSCLPPPPPLAARRPRDAGAVGLLVRASAPSAEAGPHGGRTVSRMAAAVDCACEKTPRPPLSDEPHRRAIVATRFILA